MKLYPFFKKIAPIVCYIIGFYYGYLFILEAIKYTDLHAQDSASLTYFSGLINLHDHRDMFIAVFALYLGVTLPKFITTNETRGQSIYIVISSYLLKGVAIALTAMAVIVSGIMGDDGGFGVLFIFPIIFAIAIYFVSRILKKSGDNMILPKKKYSLWGWIGLLVSILLFWFFINAFKNFG